jgi:ribosomal protein L11 methylase PrmA
VANIETRVLRDLLPGFHALLRPGGWLVLGGITDREWEGMAEAVQADFALEAVDEDGEWRSGLFRHWSSTREPGPHAGALEHEPMPAREVGG